ncbi:MAG: oligosaccharide flippase family protein, partial [Enterococcus lemanii]
MRTNQKLLSNMIYSGLFQLLYLIIPVITIPYVARVFSPAQLGIYATSYAVALFLIRISSFGIPLYGTRAIAQAKTKKEHSQILLNLWSIQIIAT